MKKILMISAVVIVLVVGGMTVMAWMGSRANESALVEIKDAPNVIVLGVSGMT